MQALLINGHSFVGSYFYKYINDFIDVDIYDSGLYTYNPSYKLIPNYNEDLPSSLPLTEVLNKEYDYVFFFNMNSSAEDLTSEFFPVLFETDRFIYIPNEVLNGITVKNIEEFSTYLYRTMNNKGLIDVDWKDTSS